jgi:hypothetical protein
MKRKICLRSSITILGAYAAVSGGFCLTSLMDLSLMYVPGDPAADHGSARNNRYRFPK